MADEFIAKEGQPATIAFVAAFLFLAAAVALITAISLMFPASFWNGMWDLNRPAYLEFEKLGSISGIMLMALGAGAGAAGIGLLRRKKWAWWSAIALFAVNGIGDVAALFVGQDLVKGGSGVLIAACFLFCLTRSKVMRYFDHLPAKASLQRPPVQ
jgi:hypothetical protein